MRMPTLLDHTPLIVFLLAASPGVPLLPISRQTLDESVDVLPAHTEMAKLLITVVEGFRVLPLMWKTPLELLVIVSMLMPVFCTCEIVLPVTLALTDPAP